MRLRKKLLIAAAGTVATIGIATSAFAYWTTTGAGDGSAKAVGSNGTVVLHGSFSDGIYPGGSKSVSFTADSSSDTDLRVGTIHLASVSVDSGHAACVLTDFSMPDVTSNTTVLHQANGQALSGSGTLSFANDADHSQDACKGATVTLNLTSN